MNSSGRSLDRRWLIDAGISSRHLDFLLGYRPLIETTALQMARAFRSDPRLWCLVLSGSHGVGKTVAAEWLMVEAIRAKEVALDGVQRVVRPFDIRDACFDPARRQKLQKMRLLAIDDLGCEIGAAGSVFGWYLDELIDFRWRHEKTTVVTTNLTGRELNVRYGARFIERLRNASQCVSLAGPDLRE